MRQFKIRASAIGQIMTNGTCEDRGKMGKTCKSYLDQWIKEQIYGRTKEFSNKYTEKGLTVEVDSLNLVAEHLGYGLLFKNEDRFKNRYITGTPDCILSDHIIDFKSSWDCFTFPLFESVIDKDYFAQGQGYMDLTGRDRYKLIYTLIDTPKELIYKEASSYCYKNGLDLDDEILKEFTQRMTYPDIPIEKRIKVFEFEKDQNYIDSIYQRVIECRKYIKERLLEIQ